MEYKTKILSNQEKLDWIRLIRSENIGPRTFINLLDIYGSASEALKKIPQMSLRGGRSKPIKVCSLDSAKKEVELCKKYGARVIALCENEYPKILRNIPDPPPVITVLGDVNIFKKKSISLVGSRNASANSCKIVSELARDIGKGGFNTVSGLARGIDACVHKSSIDTGTIAVIAGGINNIYPQENRSLYAEIPKKGIIISEMPFNTIPKPHYFPRRNRIISGLSLATIVIEARLNSGSLITASYALDQGRDVFAVPGSPADPRSKGSNSLIKKGAYVVETFQDILDVLSGIGSLKENTGFDFETLKIVVDDNVDLSDARSEVISKLGINPTLTDDIIRYTGLSASIVITILLELELAEKVDRIEGNKFSLKCDSLSYNLD